MASKTVSLRIKGVSPLLMHNPIGLMRTGGSDELQRGGKRIPSPKDEATAGLYRLPNDQLFVPSDAVREAALAAAADVRDDTRKGRAMMTRRFGASVFLSTEYFPLYRPGENGDLGAPITASDADWEVHVKRVVVQHAGVMRGRALVRDWACDVEFEIDDTTIDQNIVYTIVNLAGKYPGLLDYRPGKKGPYGRFQAVKLLGVN